jgi:hypothetical protein
MGKAQASPPGMGGFNEATGLNWDQQNEAILDENTILPGYLIGKNEGGLESESLLITASDRMKI